MFARQRLQPGETIPRHVHRTGYAAIVLAGSYEEAGDQGVAKAVPGTVLFHGALDAHLDRMGRKGADILNLELPLRPGWYSQRARLDDPDALARMAERDDAEALSFLLANAVSLDDEPGEWPHRLACDIGSDPALEFGHWAEEWGLRAETVSRRFKTVFGVSPKAFRAHARVKRARTMIIANHVPLAHIACRCGFSDQSHMTREIKSAVGVTPAALRRAVK